MKSAGKILKNKREELSLSLKEVSKKIKIKEKYLRALESNNNDVFDSKVVARGFLIKYSDFLKLNTDKLLAFWRREFTPNKKKSPLFSNKGASKFSLTPRVLLTALFFIVLSVFLTYGFYQYNNFKKPPELEVYFPEDGTRFKKELIIVRGEISENSQLYLNDKLVNVGNTGDFSENLYMSPGINNINLKAVNDLGIETTKKITVYNDIEVSNSTESNKVSENILYVENTGSSSVFLEVFDGERTLFSGRFLQDAKKEFRGDSLKIYTESVEDLSLSYNDEQVDKGESTAGVFYREFGNKKDLEEEK